jgi:hypothetical protein
MNPLSRVQVGKSRLHITRLGLGGAALGGLYRDLSEDTANGTVRRALELGRATFNYLPASTETLEKVRRIEDICRDYSVPLRRPPFNSRWPIPRLHLSSQGRGRELKWRKTFGWLDIPSRPNPGPTCAGRNYGPRKHLFPLKRTPETQGCLKTDFAVDSNLDEHKRIRRVHLA